jgi:hypothetical protein
MKPIFWSCLLLLASCTTHQLITPDPKKELDIQEAVFRYQFPEEASGVKNTEYTYFLSIDDRKDPSPLLLSRFKDEKPPVKAVSRATFSTRLEDEIGVRDPDNNNPGVVFEIESIK